MRQIVVCACLVSLICGFKLPWVKPDQLNAGLPSSISIYTLNTTASPFQGNLTGAFAKFNMNDNNLELIVRDCNADLLGYYPKTPMQYAAEQENVVYAVINGGYFDMSKNISSSFLAEKGRVKSKNSINQDASNHPTIGAIGITQDNKISVQYIYSYPPNLDTYKFQRANYLPGPAPTPDQGQRWPVKEGIGAGPILVKNTNVILGNVQNFNYDYMIRTRHPRSSICIDSNNNLYLLAMDGRYYGSTGLNMTENAQVMQSINCWDALNLDGGGSTLLYANGHVVNRPSDPTGPRKVVSALLIRDRYNKKNSLITQE